MRNFKKVIAAGLALLMLALSVNVSFAAENYSDAEAVAVAKVNAAGIMQGTDKGFEPSKTLTRAEAAAIFVRMKGISENTVKQSAGSTLFTDVAASHWAAGYINVASNYGIIVGVGANKFAPEKEVSVAEFYTMAIRALGAGKLVDSEGVWPTNYVNFAIENDLAEDVAQVYTETAKRITAAIIAANTLETRMWVKTSVKSNGEIEWTNKDQATILAGTLKISKAEAQLCESVKPTDHLFNTKDVEESFDLSNIKVGMIYDYWKNEDGVILGIWESEKNKDEKIEFTEIKKYASDKIKLVVDGKEKEYNLDDAKVNYDATKDDNIVVIYNESTKIGSNTINATNTTELGKALPSAGNKNASGVAYVKSGCVKSIFVTEYTAYSVVDEVTDKKVTFKGNPEKVYGTSVLETSPIRLDKKDYVYSITKDGKAISFTDLEEDDCIRYYTIGDKIVAEVVELAAEGKISGTASGYVKVDGEKFNTALTITLDTEIKGWANPAGDIVVYEKIKNGESDVAIVKYIRDYDDKYGDDAVEVKLFLLDGSTTDTLTVDLSKTKDEFQATGKTGTATITGNYTKGSASTVITADPDNATDDDETVITLGSVVCYEITGEKVTFKPVDEEFKTLSRSNTKLYTFEKGTKAYVEDTTSGAKAKAYVDESTNFVAVKAKDYKEIKVELVKFEDINNSGAAGYSLNDSAAVLVNYDADAKSCEAVILNDADLVRSKAANFAFIADSTKIKDGDKDAYELDVIYTDGTTAKLIAKEDNMDSGKFDDFVKGHAYDLNMKDEKYVSDYTELAAGELVANDTIKDFDSKNNQVQLTAGTWYDTAEDLLVLFLKDGEYSVKDITDIKEKDAADDTDYDVVVSSSKAYNDDNIYENVIIVFKAK